MSVPPAESGPAGVAPSERVRLDTAPRDGTVAARSMDDPSSLSKVRIGVVVPAYRVARHIEAVVRNVPPFVRTIIVVVDASPDDTAERVRKLADPRVTLIVHEKNQGVGGAMQTGFREAVRRELDIVVKMDGDDQMDPAEIPRLIEPLVAGRADMTKGNRYEHVGALRSMPAIRILGNAGLTFLVKLASGYWSNFDPANGFIAVRTEVLRRIDLARLHKRYFFESGFLIQLGILRAVIQDVAIPARYGDEVSSLSIPRTIFGFPPKLVWGLVRRVFWRYFVYDFTAVSLFLLIGIPLLLWGVIYGSIVWLEVQAPGAPPATAGQVMIAAMPILLGVQFLSQCVALDIQGVPRQPLCGPLAEG
jgi:dolichol-phosphate mannosyltransferase